MSSWKEIDWTVTRIDVAVWVRWARAEPDPRISGRRFMNRKNHGIVYYLDGDSDYHFTDRTIHAQRGDLLYIPKGCDYTVTSTRPGGCIAINFDAAGDPGLPGEAFSFANHEAFADLFMRAQREWGLKKGGYAMQCMVLLYGILALIRRSLDAAYVPSRKAARIKASVAYLEEHYACRELTVRELAGRSGMSEAYFRRLFHDVYRMPPVRYLNRIRISHAKDLLAGGFASVGEAAGMVGYADVYYFSRIFKKLTGQSPTEYLAGL